MKRIITTILAITLALTIPFSTSASGTTNDNVHTINGMTIEFMEDSSFTTEEQAAIVQFVANGADNSSSVTYNLWCSMFGHNTTTESFTVIEHCVRDEQPRCVKTLQDVTACSRCDYVSTEIINSYYVMCCE